jgi:hypothetical protein
MIKIILGEGKLAYYNKLSVFDFDNTLFKSPDKPKGYKNNWWIEEKSLNPPYVPKKPDDFFWNLDVVEAAKKELENGKTFCMLLTGRIDNVFDDRVREILKQKDLSFNFIKLNSFGNHTGEFKVKEIRNFLKKNPTVRNIEMWEDEQDKIELYTSTFSNNYNFKINEIKGRDKN